MSQSLSQVYLHIVFSTKNRRPFLRDEKSRHDAFAYLAGICHNLKCPSLIVGGVEDHAHILCRLGKAIDIVTLLRELKRDSSKWIKKNPWRLSDFQWQAGYGVFSLSPSHIKALTAYIQNQEEHQRHETFQDEFRRLCKKYGIKIDERYAWN